ncbi:MAG: HRDC domain-containing protein [Desulfobacterium sp.]|nr:HRDC domain-containing protein [Desulfobacterium sp.]
MIEYTLIETEEDLAARCELLKTEKRLAFDLEADSMHHFKEKVCLVQIADSRDSFVVDPLPMDNLSALKPVFEDPSITKVFHGSDFDIRSLDRDFDIHVNNLFDTEIACRFLGIHKRSLAALLEKHFDLTLDKRFQKTDWSRRPLSKEMITYSVNDVAYLLELSEILKRRLEDEGRLAWAEEEFELQTMVRHDNNGDEPLFMRYKGAGKMGRRTLAVLENLLHLRKTMAEEKDRPLFKIISSEAIAKMAANQPETLGQLKELRALSPRQADMYGTQCVAAIMEGLKTPEKKLPLYPKKRIPEMPPQVPERIRSLKEMRIAASNRTQIEPGFLLNNTLITAIALASPETPEELAKLDGMRNWQMEALADDILSTLRICA